MSLTVVGHRSIVTAVEMSAARASLEDVELPMAACALDESELRLQLERECCPFFALSWDRDRGRRRLTVSVSQIEHEPALDAIAFALVGSGPINEDGDLPLSLTGTEAR